MIVPRAPALFLAAAFTLFLAVPACAVSMDKSSSAKDVCTLFLGADEIQFAGYQPDFSRDKYCDDFPSAGRIIFSFDFVTPALREAAVELRILRGAPPPGEETGPSQQTEVFLPPKVYQNGVFTFEHDFKESGAFTGVVTATLAGGERKSARFGFTVGRSLYSYLPLVLGGVLIAGALFVYWRHGGARRARGQGGR